MLTTKEWRRVESLFNIGFIVEYCVIISLMKTSTPFKTIVVRQPSDLIIEQIHELIMKKELAPGERLPSEPDLAKMFGTSRAQVRLAFKKLESYGILETRPQSGTYIAEIGLRILDGLLSNVISMEELFNPGAVSETRLALETELVSLAAGRIEAHELEKVKQAHSHYRERAGEGITDVDDDIYFHLKIAEYSGNPVMRHLLCSITPQMIRLIRDLRENSNADPQRLKETVREHEEIIQALENHDPAAARKAMHHHIDAILNEVKRVMPGQFD